ncbi:MAG: glycosyltransferase family 41 protein [Rhodocyclaceae bacterium]|nr:glycosyltransferase family 41 protein [Rhodocyclaceae bacterium]
MVSVKGTQGKKSHRVQLSLDAATTRLVTLVNERKYSEIETLALSTLARHPAHGFARKALSFSLVCQERFEDAIPVCHAALRQQPNDPEIYNNLGIALSMMMQWKEAVSCFERAICFNPKDPELYKNLGVAFYRMHLWNNAVPPLLKAIEIYDGDYIDAVTTLIPCLINANRLDEAGLVLNQLVIDSPDNASLLYQLLLVSLRNCDWTDLEQRIQRLRTLSRDFEDFVGGPLPALWMPGIDAAAQKRIAFGWAQADIPWRNLPKALGRQEPQQFNEPRPLRVGYVSPDFRRHPVGYILPEVIESHDRQRVETWGFSLGEEDGSDIRRRIEASFDHFVDLAGQPVRACVDIIRSCQLDILVDLAGWTTNGRLEILASRCAPVQATWLGYPGTLGHPKLADYLIGDPIVTPASMQPDLAEEIVQLPNSYLPNDTSCVPAVAPSRESEGLPNNSFVFCSMNNSYKFNPSTFDMWSEILRRIPSSVLWISHTSETALSNLKRELSIRDIDPVRIILAKRTETRADHLSRLQLADVALDTGPYNSHSTAMDALWVGVPLVTLQGETLAGRVGASLLHSCHLVELIAMTTEQYIEIACNLARDRDRLDYLRKHLVENRGSLPLFDMRRFANDLEDIYRRMWNKHCRRTQAH